MRTGFQARAHLGWSHQALTQNLQSYEKERIVDDNKNPDRQGIAPVANAIPVTLRRGIKFKKLSATFSSVAASDSVLVEAVEIRLVPRGTLCSPPAGFLPVPLLGRVPSRQSRGSRTFAVFGASMRGGRGRFRNRD